MNHKKKFKNRSNFKTRKITRYKEESFMMIKGSTNQDNITIINMYVPNKRITKTHN